MTPMLSIICDQCRRRHVAGIQCKRDKITRVLPCLLTAAVGTTKLTQKHTPSIKYCSCIKHHVMTILSVPTKWGHNAITIDMVEIVTLPTQFYSRWWCRWSSHTWTTVTRRLPVYPVLCLTDTSLFLTLRHV